MLVSNSFKLKRLLSSLEGLLHNESYNLTDNEFETIQNIINFIRMGKNSSNLTDYSKSNYGVDCGGGLQTMAEIYGKIYHPYFAIVVCLFGTVANILNITVLTRRDMACAPINRILTALAVADILVMIEYIPYAYYYYMVLPESLDFPYIGAVYMLFHAHVTQVLHTTSICLTLTLAIWRYLALRYPERSHILCSERRCILAIALSYLLPLLLCIPTYATITITTQGITENKTQYTLYHIDLSETFKNDTTLLKINFWIYAVLIKLLPCCILTVISCWLIRTLFKAKKRKEALRNYDCYPLAEIGKESRRKVSKAERRADRTTKMLVAVLVLFLITEFPQGIFAFLIGIKGKQLFRECYQRYGEIMDILALINGAINFILYCCMNRMFRATFGQIFKRKILAPWMSLPPSDVHTTTERAGGSC